MSRLQSVVLSSQLKDMLGRLGLSGTMRFVYNQRDPFFVSKTVRQITEHRELFIKPLLRYNTMFVTNRHCRMLAR